MCVINGLIFRLQAHGGCDRSAEDAYSSMAPDPAFAFVEGPCCPTLDFVCVIWTTITFDTLLLRHFISLPSSSNFFFVFFVFWGFFNDRGEHPETDRF